jgi:hypothetical protein
METPAYLYDLATVRRAHRQLTHSLPESVGLLYSLKANPHMKRYDAGVRRALAEIAKIQRPVLACVHLVVGHAAPDARRRRVTKE